MQKDDVKDTKSSDESQSSVLALSVGSSRVLVGDLASNAARIRSSDLNPHVAIPL